ncbi:coiled-coil domain-containing protein 159 isoform X1 [Cebus imitator]|uniref:coiled-coil domain-containing protein 159 isoform X1 n=2 Tax=Cebus imitator TaxID=2715852 RepID=UPI000809CAE9|nr:coiled-coil domain-containing protein 159 isoform X1 [Cebus imitator]XP_037583536.1 coiled-coil domain-containing protein 159 isoform X1 [Cebus imitator]
MALECTAHWSRTPQRETLGRPASGDIVRSVDWMPVVGSGPPPYGAPPFPNPDLKKECRNDQDVLKRHHNVAKKPLETSSSKAKAKTIVMIPDSQKLLRCELESLKSQLQAQTKAFEFLNHSVTMLEKESCLQQIKIQQLEDVLSPTGHQGEKEGHKSGPSLEQGQQELYGALAQGLQGLEKTLRDSEEVQRARTTRCLQLLAQEIHDSKKFLWEELELVREEVTCIYQKLQAQEDEISENLVNIQKMQKTQVKCRKILTKMKQQGYGTSAWPETEEILQGAGGCWKDDLQKELSDIWSAVHVLQNSIDGVTMSLGAHPKASSPRGHRGHRYLSRPLPSWDSDSDSDEDLSQPPFSKSRRSFPHGADSSHPPPTHFPPDQPWTPSLDPWDRPRSLSGHSVPALQPQSPPDLVRP